MRAALCCLLLASACAPLYSDDPNMRSRFHEDDPFGFACAGIDAGGNVDEAESERLALECDELGGTCAAEDGEPSYCVAP